VREHERAVLLVEVLIEAKPGRRASEQAGKRRLASRRACSGRASATVVDGISDCTKFYHFECRDDSSKETGSCRTLFDRRESEGFFHLVAE
jgi:hypothetical protein